MKLQICEKKLQNIAINDIGKLGQAHGPPWQQCLTPLMSLPVPISNKEVKLQTSQKYQTGTPLILSSRGWSNKGVTIDSLVCLVDLCLISVQIMII